MKVNINLQKELKSLFNVDKEFNWCVIRHLTDQKCHCVLQPKMKKEDGKNFEEANKDFRLLPDPECNNCNGAGYVFTEGIFKCMYFYPGYRWAHYGYEEQGMAAQNIFSIFIEASESTNLIYANDWFFEIDKTVAGKIKLPITRRRKMIIKEAQRMNLDGSKLEYVRLFATPSQI